MWRGWVVGGFPCFLGATGSGDVDRPSSVEYGEGGTFYTRFNYGLKKICIPL